MTAATAAVKEKAPEVSEQLGEAARRAGTVIGSAVRRDQLRHRERATEASDDAAAAASRAARIRRP